jgi:hypothetical protein
MAVRLSALGAGRTLLPGWSQVLIFLRGWVDLRAIVRLEGLGQLRNPVSSSGMEPASFRLVAYCLNQLHYRVSPTILTESLNKPQKNMNGLGFFGVGNCWFVVHLCLSRSAWAVAGEGASHARPPPRAWIYIKPESCKNKEICEISITKMKLLFIPCEYFVTVVTLFNCVNANL